MSTVEAAASLFGADGDSGPDPFAVIGNEETDTTPLPESNVNGHEGIDSFSYSHNMGQDASNLFGAEAVHSQGSQDSTWSLQPDYSSSDCPQVVGAESSNYERTQEWHTNSVQGSTHGENFVPNTTSVQEVYNAYTPSSAYESYAPAYNSALYQPPVVTQYSASQYEPAHSSYDPYKPATNATHVSLSHQPAASPYTPAVYDQYTPSVNHSYGTPSYATAPNPLPNTTVAHPPPPAPVVSASTFRPKTSNAYDPPLPPPKASKRVVSARAPRTVSPAIDPQTYPPPKQQPALSPHPPPPPPASSFSSMHPPQPPKLTHDSSTASYRAQNSYSPSGYSRLPEQHTQSIYGGPPSHNATNMHNGIDGAVDFYEVGLAPAMSAQPSHQMPLITPPRSSPSREMLEEAPTPRATPSGMFSDSVYVEETSTTQQSYSNSEFNDFRGNTPNSVHDNMSWDDPEGGLDDYPSFSNNAEESSRSYSPYKPNREGAPSPKPSSPSPPANDVKDVYSNRYSSSSFDRPSSPAKPTYHRENSLINGNGSSRPPSVHSRTGSYGSGVSPRSPVPRVSSPLRDNTISAAQISYPPPSNMQPVNASDTSTYNPPFQRTASSISVRSGHNFPHPIGPNNSTPPTNQHAHSYNAKSYAGIQRTASPVAARSQQVSPAPAPLADPYAPLKGAPSFMPPNYRERSSSNGSTFSAASGLEISTKRKNDYSGTSPLYPSETGSYGNVSAYPVAQEIHMSPPSRAPYAPSPSLVGANDPLGRTASRAPLITFGFGGKVVTCFHNSADLITGFDVALSSRRSTDIQVRTLHNVLPQGILDSSTVSYPGPLFSDPGTPVTGLVRTGASAQVKTKKARVLKYLEERTDEISRGVSYVSNILEKRHMEDKLALVKLLMVLVDNDGTLSGSQHIDGAVRAALVPNAASAESAQDGLFAPSFTSPIPNAHGLAPAIPTINEAPIAVTTLLPSALDKIEDFLVRGERKQAYHYALDEKLWAHAMVIASSIDKDAWKEVVQEFIKTELGSYDISKHGAAPGSHEQSPSTNGREWLRVAYSLFSGQGPTAIQQLIPTKLLAGSTGTLQLPTAPMAHITPMSPNFPAPNVTAQIPVDSLCKWREIVSTLISTPLAPDWSATLTALGDYLISHNFVEAAHACYLLSPQTSVIGGVGSPSARVVLVGARSPHSSPSFAKDFDSIIFSEIAEFAFSLKQPAKGQDPFHGFPHLQAYKMIRASYLMEMGYVQVATRYCEAISGSMGRPSPYFNTVLSDQLKGLADRLIGAPHVGKGVAWIGGKMSKPSLDSIGNWLEGRLTKFIAGEGDEPSPAPPHQSSSNQQSAFAGPFSTISSTTTSASPSPPPSMINIHAMSGNVPPRRTGSAMAIPSAQAHAPIDRASSAMEYYRPGRSSSPGPRQPYNPPSVPMASPYGHMGNGHASNGYSPAYATDALPRKPSLEITAEEGPNQDESESGGWWNSLNSADSAPTPTAANFHQVDNYSPSQDGFISLMDDPALSVTPSPPISQSRQYEGDDMDDLGLGNSNKHSRAQETEVGSGETTSSPTTASAHPNDTTEVKPPAASAAAAAAASGSWLSRFWKRGDTAPGPVKASLGEETSFYYDKDQKRWVNKKAGAEDVKPATPPPPPSRAQTASPGRTTGLPAVPNSTPPPQRSASAIDLSNSPPNKPPMRIRSNLVPPEFASVPNTPATAPLPGMSGTPPPSASLGGPPPPGRPRSQATKRNVRSRYVDVFQQEASA